MGEIEVVSAAEAIISQDCEAEMEVQVVGEAGLAEDQADHVVAGPKTKEYIVHIMREFVSSMDDLKALPKELERFVKLWEEERVMVELSRIEALFCGPCQERGCLQFCKVV